jgi:hypothetical protein
LIFYLNIVVMILTILLGLVGWLAPNFTMDKLGLQTIKGSNMGLSEIRAANGALFVGAGAGALVFSLPVAFAMVGCLYAGAALGRITSIMLDKSGSATSWSYFTVELVLAAFLLIANVSAIS